MPVLPPSTLPIELIEKIIDEVFYSELSANTLSGNTMVDPAALSSLALVSHIFRQRVNAHRFSTVSFLRSNKHTLQPLSHIHAFRDLLQSDVWVAPSMGVARHVRKLELVLGESISMETMDTVPHRATEDGSFITIMDAVFRGGEGSPYATSDYALALWGFMGGQSLHWDAINAEFIANIARLVDSRIAKLELTVLNDVNPTLLKGRCLKHIALCCVWLRFANRHHIADFRALGPWNHIETLDVLNAPFFELAAQGDLPILKALTVTLQDSDMAKAISCHWRHWSVLEDLTLNLDNGHIFPSFRVDYTNLSNLTRLSITLRLGSYNSSTSKSSIDTSTHQILHLLGPHLPPLARLALFIEGAFHVVYRGPDTGAADDIPTQIDCAALDAVLAQHPPSAIGTISLRFGIALSRGEGTALALETFREDGLGMLRGAFPCLNAGPRRRVYGSEVSMRRTQWRWGAGEHPVVLQYRGTFSVEYTCDDGVEEEGVRAGQRALRTRA